MLSYCLARQHLHVSSGGLVAVGNQQHPVAGMKGTHSPGPGMDGFAGGRRRRHNDNDNNDEDDDDDELYLYSTLHT